MERMITSDDLLEAIRDNPGRSAGIYAESLGVEPDALRIAIAVLTSGRIVTVDRSAWPVTYTPTPVPRPVGPPVPGGNREPDGS